MWTVAIFFAGMTTLFILLILGVQYNNTYIGNGQPSFATATDYVLKKVLTGVKNSIYPDVTIQNPPKNTVPDSWDNTIVSESQQVF